MDAAVKLNFVPPPGPPPDTDACGWGGEEGVLGVAEWQAQIRAAMPLTESRTLSGRRRQWAEPPRLAALYNDHRFERAAFGWDMQFDHQLRPALRMGLDGVYSDHVDTMVDAFKAELGAIPSEL